LGPAYSVQDIPEFDPDAEITSPRSLDACEMEGVQAEELVYTPFSEYNLPGVDPLIVRMRHDFHEARRQDLLAVVRHRRQAMLLGDGTLKLDDPGSPASLSFGGSTAGSFGGTSPKSWKKLITSPMALRPKSPGLIPAGEHNPAAAFPAPGAPPNIAPFPNTYEYFGSWNKELAASEPPPQEGSNSSPASPTTNQSMASPGAGDGAQGQSAGKNAPATPQSPNTNRKGSTAPMQANEEHFLQQLHDMRTCDGNDRVEHDFATNSENQLVSLRADADKSRAAVQHEERRLVKKRNHMQEHTFERLLGDCFDNRDKREVRENYSRPDNAKLTNMQAEWAELEFNKVELAPRKAKMKVDIEANKADLEAFIPQKTEVVVANRELKFKRPQLIVLLRDTPVELEAQLKTLDGKTKELNRELRRLEALEKEAKVLETALQAERFAVKARTKELENKERDLGTKEAELRAYARHQLVFANNVTTMKALVTRRVNHLDSSTDIIHARTEKLAQSQVLTKMAFSQCTMHERLRWRKVHHENVTLKTARFEAEKMAMFEAREADLQRRQAVADNRGSYRQELYRLRNYNRNMNEELRNRKARYEKNKHDVEHGEWKRNINATSTFNNPVKMTSNLASSWPLSPASMEKSLSAPSLAMSRPVPTHMASPLSASLREGKGNQAFPSWFR